MKNRIKGGVSRFAMVSQQLVRGALAASVLVQCALAATTNIGVAVLLPLTGPTKHEGEQYRQTALRAAEYVNNQTWMVQADVALQIAVKDTASTEYGAWLAANDASGTSNPARVLVGPSYSGPALAASVAAEHASVPMILFDATSPSLSQKDFVMRTCATDQLYSDATLSTLRYFGWQQFGVVYSATAYARAFKETLSLGVHKLGQNTLAMKASAEFSPNSTTMTQEIQYALDEIANAN